jgi:TPR repeat protein
MGNVDSNRMTTSPPRIARRHVWEDTLHNYNKYLIGAAAIFAFFLNSPAPASAANDCINFMGISGAAAGSYDSGQYERAFKFYNILKDCNQPSGYIGLGRLYEHGHYVTRSYEMAAKYYRAAAQMDHPWAALLLARLYANGTGVLQDYVRAHIWANIAGLNGYGSPIQADALELLKFLSARMTPIQLAEAQSIAKKCSDQRKNKCE